MSIELLTFEALAAGLRVRAAGEPEPPTAVVGIDGLSGAGKTWFAGLLGAELGAPVVATDEFVPGWSGLAESVERLAEWILAPARQGDPLRYRRYDWRSGRPVEWVEVPAAPLLVVEGCGVLTPPAGDLLWFSVWIDAPVADRRARLEARADWASYAPYAEGWARQEARLHQCWSTARRADLVVDNASAARPGRPGAFARSRSAGVVARAPGAARPT
ncbi:MAG TPA: hypothetical protein VKG43_13805 [Acidimicrobiales bacterium]|nr:hypothetical protein [Acidimicrobiales bacterium]